MTLESSHTSIAYMASADEAAFFVRELQSGARRRESRPGLSRGTATQWSSSV
jgi:hypothetical protein